MTRFTRNSTLLVWLVVVCSFIAVAYPVTSVSFAAPPVTAPNSLAATVNLGQSSQQTLTLTSTSSSAQLLRFFEAFEPSSMANARMALPEELRSVQLPDKPWRIDPKLEADLAADRTAKRDFLVFLSEQADLSSAYSTESWRDRGSQVYSLLESEATSTQSGIRQLLNQRGVSFRSFWIVNALEVHGSYDDLQALAARSEVGLIEAVQTIAVDPLLVTPSETTAALAQCQVQPDALNNSACWHLLKTGVDRIWDDFGATGAGITVGNIDTGVNFQHQALLQQYRGNRGTWGFEHAYNWFDPQGMYIAPDDANGHGTHTMGVIVGRGNGTVDQPAIGVAPDATWIAAQGCENTTCSTSDLIASAQWMLAPTDQYGQNPRPDLRPQILNNSWAGGGGGDDWYSGYTAAWRAAGIFPVFAAGNKIGGAECESISSPGDYPDVLAVGATDSTDTVASFSRRGPTKDGRVKPDLSAPGVDIVSAYMGSADRYASLQGTSMAAPHVTGLIALMWSANPSLIGDYDATYALLTSTTKQIDDNRCGDSPGQPNNLYGYGRIQAYEAMARATVDVPWLRIASSQTTLEPNASKGIAVHFDASKVAGPGVYTARILIHGQDLSEDPRVVTVTMTVPDSGSLAQITGKVLDAVKGYPLVAEVGVVGGARVKVDATGTYTVTLPTRAAPYELVASASSYISQTKSVVLDSPVGATQSFSLTTDMPKIMVDTTAMSTTLSINEQGRLGRSIHNIGTKPLSYTAEIVVGSYGVWPSNNPSPTSTLQEPNNATKISLSDDNSSDPIDMGFAIPLFNTHYREVYINANGMLAFGIQPNPVGYRSSCTGIYQTSGVALMPFYADLDPSKGGTISYASTSEGFVVTYKDIPLHTNETSSLTAERYSFQVVIKRNGDFQYRYSDLGTLPRALTIGVQENTFQAQIISCTPNKEIKSGLVYDLRRQPSSELWSGLIGGSALVEPGSSAQFQINLVWIRPNAYQQPLRGTLVIRSNDLFDPEVQIPFLLSTKQAPYELYFPLVPKR